MLGFIISQKHGGNMQAILAPLREIAEYDEIQRTLNDQKGPVSLTGCVDSQKLHIVYGLSQDSRYRLILTYSDLRAKEIYEEYKFYDRNVMLYPAKDLIFFQADIHGNRLVQERIKVLRRIMEKRPVTIVATYASIMTPQAFWNEDDIISLELGSTISTDRLSGKLVDMGYEKTYQVEEPGQFSVRGGIIDIFDLTEENPYRIELWGDEVDSIRSFDVLSQRSIEKLESIRIFPATEFVMDSDRIHDGLKRIEKEAKKQEVYFRDQHMPEEAHRIITQFQALKEQLTEFRSLTNLESYVQYFYDVTVNLAEILAKKESNREIDAGAKLGIKTGISEPPKKSNKDYIIFVDEPVRVKEQAQAIEMVNRAAPSKEYLSIRSMEAAEKMADGQATKIIVPSDLQGVATLAKVFEESK